MSDSLSRNELLEVLEKMLDGQVRALRSLRSGRLRGGADPARGKKKSNISIIKDVLLAAGEPLHINEIILRAHRDHGRELKRESIVSALTKRVLDRRTFRRTARNEFALLGKEED
jgi:hypothetical protein